MLRSTHAVFPCKRPVGPFFLAMIGRYGKLGRRRVPDRWQSLSFSLWQSGEWWWTEPFISLLNSTMSLSLLCLRKHTMVKESHATVLHELAVHDA